MSKRVLQWLLLLVGAFALSGCMTGKVLDSARAPQTKIRKDVLHEVKQAYLVGNRQVAVLMEASLGGSGKPGRYTLLLPLDRHLDEARKQGDRMKLPRNSVRNGWLAESELGQGSRPIPLAPPIHLRARGTAELKDFIVLPAQRDTLYVVHKPLDYLSWELAYVSHAGAGRDRVSIFELKEDTSVSENPAYYLLLPLTVPLDMALFPFELVYLFVH
jgi:hypothetical protein